jgi:hypothetical protein
MAVPGAAAEGGGGGGGGARRAQGLGLGVVGSSSSSSRSCSRSSIEVLDDGTSLLLLAAAAAGGGGASRGESTPAKDQAGLALPHRIWACLTGQQHRQYKALLPEHYINHVGSTHNHHSHQQHQQQEMWYNKLLLAAPHMSGSVIKGFRGCSLRGLGSWGTSLMSAPMLACWVSLLVGATPRVTRALLWTTGTTGTSDGES